MMLGRLSSGLQADHGTRVHAVHMARTKRLPCPFNDWGKREIPNDDYQAEISLCGKRPGRRSVGWSSSEDEVDCPACLKRISKIK